MQEQGTITSIQNRVERQLRQEIVCVQGVAAMSRDRYIEHLRSLRKARWSRDYPRAKQIIDELRTFLEDSRSLQAQERTIFERLVMIAAQEGFIGTPGAGGVTPHEL